MSAQRQRAYLSRSESARHSNEHIAAKAEGLRFVARVPMLCECDDGDCQQIFLITLEAYREARRVADFLTVPGHVVGSADAQIGTNDYWLQRRDS